MQVTIVGAGVIGLSLAWELAQRNVAVRVLERGNTGHEASWAASGILPATGTKGVLDPLERLRAHSHALYPRWTQRLAEATGIDCGLRRCGGIYLASSAGEAASLIGNLSYQRELGVELHSLTAEQLNEAEPGLAILARSNPFRAAILSPDEYRIRPRDLLAALLAACLQDGVVVNEQAPASIHLRDGLASVETATAPETPSGILNPSSSSNQSARAERIVICGGAWTGQVATRVGLGESIIPIRGQIMMYRFESPPLRHVINEGHRYLVPREDGCVLIGSCEEEVGFQKGTTREMLEPLRRWAESILPSLMGREPETAWSGLRPGTFDGFPLIGKVPEVANLYVAAGHYRSGIHLAPATAKLLADLLTDQIPAVDASAFAVGRMIAQK